MQPAQIKSTEIQKNRAGKEILTCVVELRKGQNVTAEYINGSGEAYTPVNGEWCVVVPREQSIGGYLAFGFVDILNKLVAAAGAKILLGRDSQGNIKTKLALTEDDIILNDGEGTATETARLQEQMEIGFNVIHQEFSKVAAGTLPNPSAPYVPSPTLPVNVLPAKSEKIKIP